MNDGTPEPRTPVMIMVEATWQDQSGTVQSTRARMENKSPGGACIRLNKRIEVGTKLKIQGQWDRFTGEARYCRQEGRDYLVGIQKDRTERPVLRKSLPKEEVAKQNRNGAAQVIAEVLVENGKKKQERDAQAPTDGTKVLSAPVANGAEWTAVPPPSETPCNPESMERQNRAQGEGLEGLRNDKERIRQPSLGQKAGIERKHMRRKWFEMGHKDDKQEGLSGVDKDQERRMNRMPVTIASVEETALESDREDGTDAQVELLSMEDIYRMAGILNPRKGYSINKIVEMLRSEHLRGLSKELKRASVLMALDAAGIPVEEVLQDAKARREAIDSYEAEQRKQFEAQLARKAEENVQIQAELERVKARYTERLRRNLDGMAREKATFGNWLTLKQQEAQSMAEAVDLCVKAPTPEAPSTALEEVSLAGARVKPV